MRDELVFDYYYGKEAEQFSFYRIPRMLIKDTHFSALSSDAKILYGLMLDRMSLSMRNGWQDDEDRTYVIYTIDNIMEDLNCCKTKAVKTLNELDVESGIGLVEKKRQGLGKPDLIYVKNFVGVKIKEEIKDTEVVSDINSDYVVDETIYFEDKDAPQVRNFTEVHKMDFKKSTEWTSRGSQNGLQEVRDMDFKKYGKQTSGSMKNGLQEVQVMDPNYNNNNQTDFSNTQYNQNNDNYTDNSYISSNPINPGNKNFFERTKKSMEKMDEINEATDYLKDIIEYDVLCEEERNGKKLYDMSVVDELIDVMVSAMTSSKPYINIGGEDIPIQRIKSRFEKYNMNIFQYAYDSLKDNTTKVKNIRKYMLAVLFNAPMTINSFYRAEVNHDFYGG